MSFADILNAREDRWLKKRALASEKKGNVVSLTLRMPASVWLTGEAKAFLMHAALKAEGVFSEAGYHPKRECTLDGADGPCVLWRLMGETEEIKLACIEFEEESPEGELIDLDVMGEDGEEISRTAFQNALRKCIVCRRENARECIYEKRHSNEETERIIKEKLGKLL